MRPVVCNLLLAAFPAIAFGQLSDNFNDGDLTRHPSWQGTDSAFTVLDGVLCSRHATASSTFYLSVPVQLSGPLEWEWWMHLDFSTSSVNYADVYLLSPDAALGAGYFVRIGNTADEVSLYCQPPGGTARLLIDGRDGMSAGPLRIRATRSSDGAWNLYTNQAHEGEAADHTFPGGAYFGLKVRQSTSSFFRRHYFDDFIIRPLVPDTVPPKVLQLETLSPEDILIRFSEAVDSAACRFSPEVKHLRVNGADVRVSLAVPLQNGVRTAFSIKAAADLHGNFMPPLDTAVLHYTPVAYDVLIHEILADPSPAAGLPEYEYVELRNRSSFAVNLAGWALQSGSNTITLPAYVLQPDSLVVVCGRMAFPFFHPAVDAGGFLPLGNEGGTLSLFDPQGRLVHVVRYTRDWYQGSIKDAGGWSLEMTDPQWPCTGAENWKASTHPAGGTPGRYNATAAAIPEPAIASLIRISIPDSTHMQLHFSGMVDSASAAQVTYYNLPGIERASVAPDVVTLHMRVPIRSGALKINGIRDCSGRMIVQQEPLPFALPQQPDSLDLVINEILFDPPQGAEDFIEIFNKSGKAIELGQLYFASRDREGRLQQAVLLTRGPFLCMPGDYLAFSPATTLCRYYSCGATQHISSLPTLPQDEGSVVLLRGDGQVIDEVHYDDSWHHGILLQTKGISLERLHPAYPSNDPHNWHSAAASAGFATPGAQNSQFRPATVANSGFTLASAVFSPDNDGQDDVALLAWDLPQGQTANITIFDHHGRPVRHLARNLLLSARGRISWNGLSDAGLSLPPGIYVIFIQVFHPQGAMGAWKLPLVLAGGK